MDTEITASEALYGFMGWLTSRDEVSGPFSAKHEAASAAELVHKFCEANKLTEPTEDGLRNAKHPKKE